MHSNWSKHVLTFTIGWIISLLFWRLLRIDQIQAYLEFVNVNFSNLNFVVFISIISILAGLTFGSFQYYNDHVLKRKSSFKLLLIKSFIGHVLIMLFIYFIVFISFRFSEISTKIAFVDFIKNPIILINFVYSLVINVIIVSIIHLNKLLGKGNLLKLLTGTYYKPKEEFRVFLFIDLQSSTEIAERLGHIEYSQLIQDCFYQLSVFENSKAEVYQYVGDEAVLTWKFNKKEFLNNHIESFFLFKDKLTSDSNYYTSKYGVHPIFKAGMHLGDVTVAEVGSLKREIAFHGDTLNIASRIQAQCNTFKKDFLISADILEYVDETQVFEFERLKELVLRGKKETTTLISVTKKQSNT